MHTSNEDLHNFYSLPDIKEDEMRDISCMSRVGRWKICIILKGIESGAVITRET
jgi:hypothetical protein